MEALPENSIDSFIQEGIDQAEQFKMLADKHAVLLHRVFVQSEAGAELLAKWKDDLLMIPSVKPHYTAMEAGLNEGPKMLIRSIITQIQSVESEL